MNTRTILSLIAVGGAFAALEACSSSDNAPYASSDDYCTARAAAECNQLAKKCGRSVDSCETSRDSVCTAANSTALAQNRSYHSERVQACLDSINSTYANNAADTTPDEEATTADICNQIFTGSITVNQACTVATDPTTSNYECDGSMICSKGLCEPPNNVALGAQCNNAGDVCATGSFCQSAGQTSLCVADGAMGAQCSDTAPCIETLRCATTCEPKVVAGQLCSTDDDCSLDAPYCDPDKKTCRPKYESDSPACDSYGT